MTTDIDSIEPSDYDKVVVLTGAGISVASGLATYRGEGGMWDDEEAVAYAHADQVYDDPAGMWRIFGPMRERIVEAAPNPGHTALATFEAGVGRRASFTLLTQNVDGLHQAAGSEKVIELHGNLRRTRCSDSGCGLEPYEDEASHVDAVPECPLCGAFLRPDVIFFGEMLPENATHGARMALRGCDLFMAIGTSGTVSPASNFVRSANDAGARTIFVNPEPSGNPYFEEDVRGKAEELLPRLFSVN